MTDLHEAPDGSGELADARAEAQAAEERGAERAAALGIYSVLDSRGIGVRLTRDKGTSIVEVEVDSIRSIDDLRAVADAAEARGFDAAGYGSFLIRLRPIGENIGEEEIAS